MRTIERAVEALGGLFIEYPTPLREEAKALWLTALRSNQYEQATGALTIVDANGNKAHCCYGVGCVIMPTPLASVIVNPHDADLDDPDPRAVEVVGYYDRSYGDDQDVYEYASLPKPARVFYFGGAEDIGVNLEWTDTDGRRKRESFSLMSLNDELFTFAQIGDVIAWFY
jgi:hypothetical protein